MNMNKRKHGINRIISMTLAVVLLLFSVVPAGAATSVPVNSDGNVNSDGTKINSDGAINSDGNKASARSGARVQTFSAGRSVAVTSSLKKLTKGWHSVSGYRYYFYATGKFYTNKIVSISGKKYYFDKNGHLLYGVNAYGSDKYYSDSNGAIKTSAGFVNSSGYRYYVQSGGKIMAGHTFKVSGKIYKAYGTGRIGTGVFLYGTKAHFYADKNGVVRTKPGFITYNGYRYYITKNAGRIECGRTFKVNGKTYKAYGTGKIGTGVFLYGTTARFYADKNGVVKLTAGFVTYGGKKYYVQKGGRILLGRTFKVKSKTYKAFADGHLGTGIFKYGSKYYYGDANGVVTTKAGVVTYNKKYYYVQSGGAVAMNQLITVGSKKYMATETGALKTGFFEESGTKYYANSKGEIITKTGFLVVNGKTYYIQKGGAIFWGHTFTVNGKTYKAYGDGRLGTGLFKYGSYYYYADGTGAVKTTAGLITLNGKKYYVQKGGKIAASTTITTGGTTYKADASGVLTAQKTSGTELMKIAQKEVGTKTGKKYWEAYFGTKFRNGDATPWCGTFVTWCFKQAGLYSLIKDIQDYGNLGYVPSYTAYANKKKLWVSANKAKAGDIIIFGSSQHVGLVKSVSGNIITTIEGNTGSTTNGEVKQKTYTLSNSWIKGVMRVIK